MNIIMPLAASLWLGVSLVHAQPLEQNFSFGAPSDVLGNAGPHGVRPPLVATEPAPAPRRVGARRGRSKVTSRRSRNDLR